MAKGISVSGIFEKLEYTPHEVQKAIHRAWTQFRFRVVCAGRRTGKSHSGGHELTTRAIKAYANRHLYNKNGRRSEHWIVGPEYTDGEKEFRVLWRDLERLGIPLDRPGSYYDLNGGNMHVSLWDGRFQVHVKSAKYPDSLVGEGLESVILAEAAKLRMSIWPKYIRPMLADYQGEALMTSTPEGKNWFYEAWQRGQDPDSELWWSIRMPSWTNPYVFPGGRSDPEILDMYKDLGEEKFNQEIAALFSEFVGAVFKNWDEEYHVGDFKYNPRWPLYIATDYGWTNPNVALFIQVDHWDNVKVIGEYYETHRTDDEFAIDVMQDPKLGPLARRATILYPDPEDPKASARLAREWKVQISSGTGGDLDDRLDLIRRWLRPAPSFLALSDPDNPDLKPMLQVDRSCKNLIREFEAYRYPENKTGNNDPEKPLKKDDHTPEALGRFFAGHFRHEEVAQHARQRVASVR